MNVNLSTGEKPKIARTEWVYILQAWKTVEYGGELLDKGFGGVFDFTDVKSFATLFVSSSQFTTMG